MDNTDNPGFAARWSLRSAIAAVLLGGLVVLLARLGVAGLSLLPALAAIVLVLAALGLILGLWGLGAGLAGRRRAVMPSVIAVILAVVVGFLPARGAWQGIQAPPIHDISTDLAEPPEFLVAKAMRGPGTHALINAVIPEQAAMQMEGYPDLAPYVVPLHPGRVFDAALETLAAMGLKVIATAPARGSIEAVAISPVMGFKDDVVVRIREGEDGGAIVDVRSASRQGVSDLGANARRIRTFLDHLKVRLGQQEGAS